MRPTIASVLILSCWACGPLLTDAHTEAGGVAIEIASDGVGAGSIDAGTVYLMNGSQVLTRSITPGGSASFGDVDPGGYTVGLEAFVSGEEGVHQFAESSVQVVAGQTAQTTLIPQNFTPGLLLSSDVVAEGEDIDATVTLVDGAETHFIRWARDADFTQDVSGLTLLSGSSGRLLTFGDPGTWYVRAEAENRFGGRGLGESELVDVLETVKVIGGTFTMPDGRVAIGTAFGFDLSGRDPVPVTISGPGEWNAGAPRTISRKPTDPNAPGRAISFVWDVRPASGSYSASSNGGFADGAFEIDATRTLQPGRVDSVQVQPGSGGGFDVSAGWTAPAGARSLIVEIWNTQTSSTLFWKMFPATTTLLDEGPLALEAGGTYQLDLYSLDQDFYTPAPFPQQVNISWTAAALGTTGASDTEVMVRPGLVPTGGMP